MLIEISELEAEPSISHPHRRSWTRAPNRHSAPHYAKQRLRARPKPPLLIKGDHLLSDTVQAPTPATQEPPTNLDLGMSPLIIALLWSRAGSHLHLPQRLADPLAGCGKTLPGSASI